jgi:spectrin beta
MQKQQMIETQMLIKSQQVTELDSQADHLARMTPEKQEEIDQKKEAVAKKFASIIEPLEVRKKELEVKKEVFQFMRDVEDDNIWMEEKMNLVTSEELGSSLQDVNMLIKKNKTLKGEIENHEHRIMSVCNVGQKLIDESHPESSEFTRQINDLMEKLEHLKHNLEARNVKLLRSEKVQQFFFDANEAEAWMSEQELYMMVEDRGKDEFSAQNLMKKHEALEGAVADYSENVRQLGEVARQLQAEDHPQSEAIGVRLSQVEKLYAGLKELSNERRAKLDDALKLFMLNREVDDLEQWIAEREVVAGSHELGQDYDHVTLLWERFREFARDTESIGSERVNAVNEIADSLISSGHTDAATIAQWKDALNDAWADLGELIDTRTQMLEASRELHKYFHDCKDVLGRILEKQHSMSDELGRDSGSVSALLRKHQNFLQDLQGLQAQVQAIQEESSKLQAAYAGDKAMEITNREREVVRAWLEIQNVGDSRKSKLNDTSDLFKFFAMVRNLVLWMDDLMRQMKTSEKPRDVSGVELLMNNHQGHKAEIDAREDNFGDCVSLGKELLSRNHYASNEIKEKLLELTNLRNEMLHRWEERWEHLQLILEVYQFARDAAVAEAWLMAQDPYLKSEELGQTIDEVENLIKKHEAFEKAAAAQEERFAALERLTTFELKELRRKQDEAEEERRRQVEEIARQSEKPDGADRRSETGSIKSGQREGDEVEGMLVRKNEWVNTTTKASNRSWDKVCVVLKGTKLLFYKDQKSYRSSPDHLYRGEPPMELQNGTAEIATDYTKKRHVFRLKLSNGGESLFQASDDDEMSQWVNAINTVADPGTGAGAGRAQTLPAGERRPGDEPKKRSFFTLKKK